MIQHHVLPTPEFTTPGRLLIAWLNGEREAKAQVARSLERIPTFADPEQAREILYDTLRDDGWEWSESALRCFPTFPDCVREAEERQAYCYAFAGALDRAADKLCPWTY